MKYQLVCPKCKHEFQFASDYYDDAIDKIGLEINEIHKTLSYFKSLPYAEQRRRKSTIDGWKRRLADRQLEISRLKKIRKVAHDHVNRYMFTEFKRIVKERYGDKAFQEILAEALEACEAYKLTDTMKHEYTRSGALPDVTNINKL